MPAGLNLFPAGTVKRSELASFKMVAGNEEKYTLVIDGNDVKEWVGFGWIVLRAPTGRDLQRYPKVVD